MSENTWASLQKSEKSRSTSASSAGQMSFSEVPTSATNPMTSSSEPEVFSVEQLNQQIKQLLEGQMAVIWVQGEISNFKAHTSGHFYFSLKDSKSQISAVMFRGSNSKLKFRPQDGLEVIVRGRISVYEPRGSYQILCEMMEPVGSGALQKAFDDLKEKLKLEGLFESTRKKPIPSFPQNVAVVTSPTGAAIRDILNVMGRRAPQVKVTLIPTLVQGEGCAEKIREALALAQKLPEVDVIILGRGGGSIEDLWGFNDENLARSIAASSIPIISAVGHEIDFTISDFVADLRAPTPSAAAELVAKSSQELNQRVLQLLRSLKLAIESRLKFIFQRTENLHSRLVDPQKRLQDLRLRNDDLLQRLENAAEFRLITIKQKIVLLRQRLGDPHQILERKKSQLQMQLVQLNNVIQRRLEENRHCWSRLSGILDSLSPLRVVDRGYSLVTRHGELIKSSAQVRESELLDIKLAHGSLDVRVEKIKGE